MRGLTLMGVGAFWLFYGYLKGRHLGIIRNQPKTPEQRDRDLAANAVVVGMTLMAVGILFAISGN